jgi:hypothetical protein
MGTSLQTQMFQFLLYFWLSLPQLAERRTEMEDAMNAADAPAICSSPARPPPARPLGDSTRQQQAQRCARASAPDYQLVRARKLAAPADGPHQSAAAGQRRQQRGAARLAWLLHYDNRNGLTEISAVEQKRDARGHGARAAPSA